MIDALNLAEEISRKYHEGQFRKNGEPYITHVELVVSQLTNDVSCQIVGWLHDVLEDTDATPEALLDYGIPEALVKEVQLLTKSQEMNYSDYIARVKSSALAVRVKKADIIANLFDNPGAKQIRKFAKALIELST